MSTTRRRALKPLFSLLIGAVAALAGQATAAAASAARPIVLAAAAPGRLELASGRAVDLALPAGAVLADVEATTTGWVAAATRPVGKRSEILLLASSGGAPVALPAPPPSAALQAEPLPLVEGGRLAGLVWLEGDGGRRLAVRSARWSGTAWEKLATISPPGPGSQLALTAARLAGGAWLLAWSAFDGHDDEILWSRFDGAAWSRPARAAPDNDVPDVTPALTAVGDGALLAWSRFDGASSYQTVVARFLPEGGGRFSPPRQVAVAAAGAVFPSFEASSSAASNAEPLLLLRTAVPAGWSLLALDDLGRTLRRASIVDAAGAASPAGRPIVAAASGGGVTLRFPATGARRLAVWEAAPPEPQP